MAKKKRRASKVSQQGASSSKSDTVKITLPKNNWKIASFILGIVLIVLLINGGFSTSVSSKKAGQSVVDFAASQGASAEVISVTKEGSLYNIVVQIQGQSVPVYVTSDGKYLIPSVIPLTSQPNPNTDSATATQNSAPAPSGIPKTDKPVIELFVMSHCPYGTQMEKGILPVVKLLEDNIDFEVKFVYYAMHGEVEVYEQLSQYCIQKEQNDKYLSYLTCFLEDGNGQRCLTAAGIDTAKLSVCTAAADKEFKVTENFNNQASYLSGRFPLFNTDKADNDKYGVGGSPTLIINGKEAQVARDSATLLKTICAAFNNAPEECNTQFDSAAPGPGFGFGKANSANNQIAGCGY